jgi:hypothetical protein
MQLCFPCIKPRHPSLLPLLHRTSFATVLPPLRR